MTAQEGWVDSGARVPVLDDPTMGHAGREPQRGARMRVGNRKGLDCSVMCAQVLAGVIHNAVRSQPL